MEGLENCELITLKQTCFLFNIGMNRARILAEESGALRKIGKTVRVKPKVLRDYIDKEYSL